MIMMMMMKKHTFVPVPVRVPVDMDIVDPVELDPLVLWSDRAAVDGVGPVELAAAVGGIGTTVLIVTGIPFMSVVMTDVVEAVAGPAVGAVADDPDPDPDPLTPTLIAPPLVVAVPVPVPLLVGNDDDDADDEPDPDPDSDVD